VFVLLISKITSKDLFPTFNCSTEDARLNSRADLFPHAKPVFSLFQQSHIAKLLIATSYDGFAYEKVIADLLEDKLLERRKVLCYLTEQQSNTAKVFELWADKVNLCQQAIADRVNDSETTEDNDFLEYLVYPEKISEFMILVNQLNEFNLNQNCKILINSNSSINKMVYANEVSELALFGEQAQSFRNNSYDSKVQHLTAGHIHHAHSGYLLVKIDDLLIQPMLWFKLKQVLVSGVASWTNPSIVSNELKSEPALVDFKLILIGEREAISQLAEMDSEVSSLAASFIEFDSEFNVNQQRVSNYLAYVDLLINENSLNSLTTCAQQQLLRSSSRWCEHNNYLSLNENRLLQLLTYANIISNQDKSEIISAADIHQVLHLQHQALNNHIKLSSEGVVEKQILLQTHGSSIGQINGLSVLELAGHPESFGEPIRITATGHLNGDGDISDVERKAELAGNIHAKAMMIIQGYFTHTFAKPLPLPINANLVFEQSYGEIDGDSAALAGSCALLSVFSQTPIKQNIAVTGAIDQFGNVLAVGGINEKIEGFYRICELQQQEDAKVIIPAANLVNLNLSPALVDAVNAGKLTILPINEVKEAIYLLMGKVAGELDDEETIYGIINKLADESNDDGYSDTITKLKTIYEKTIGKLAFRN